MKNVFFKIFIVLLLSLLHLQGNDISQKKVSLIKELLRTMQMEKTLNNNIQSMLNLQLKAGQLKQEHIPIMEKFYKKYMTYSNLEPEFIKLYNKLLTENEIKDLTNFYKTPTGKKFMSIQGQLNTEGAQIGLRIGQLHSNELRQMFKEAAKKKQKKLTLVKENYAEIVHHETKYIFNTYIVLMENPYYITIEREDGGSIKHEDAINFSIDYIKPRGCTSPLKRLPELDQYNKDKTKWMIGISC